jgi:hypothetical protein
MTDEIRVWDGTTPTRQNLSDVKNPDHMDYLILVAELQKLQRVFLSFVQNITLMPNLQDELMEAFDKIIAIQKQTNALSPPQDLKERLNKLECAILEQDTRKKLAALQGSSEDLRTHVDKHQLQVLKLKEMFNTQVTAFQSKIWNAIKTLENDMQVRLNALEKQQTDVARRMSIINLQLEE